MSDQISCAEAGVCQRLGTPCSGACQEYDPTMPEDEPRESAIWAAIKSVLVCIACSAAFGFMAGYGMGVL